MRIYRFFLLSFALLLMELFLLDCCGQPTVPLVKICCLAALFFEPLPWYALAYLLALVSLSSLAQGFSVVVDVAGFGFLAMVSSFMSHTMLHHWLVQSLLIVTLTLLFMALDYGFCLTIRNICVTILITPIMILFLR